MINKMFINLLLFSKENGGKINIKTLVLNINQYLTNKLFGILTTNEVKICWDMFVVEIQHHGESPNMKTRRARRHIEM